MNTLAPYIRRAPLISTLPPDAQADIERAGEDKSFRRRQIVFMADQANDHVYLLSSGRIKLVRISPTGREITLTIVSPMELFGETHIFEPNVCYGMSAEVLEDADVVVFRRTDIASALSRAPEALKNLAILQSMRRLQAENRLAEYVFYDVPTRIARLLARLASTHGRYSKGGSLIRLKLTHQEIANLIGSTRETTTLILNDFRRRGLIELQGRRIIVTDSEGLREIAH